MPGQIIANATKILELDDGLRNTSSQIESVMADNDELVRRTFDKISESLDAWKKRQIQAYENLIQAQEELEEAEAQAQESEDGEVPDYYYQEVDDCQKEYDRISNICASIERIFDDFSDAATSYKRAVESSRQEYISTLQKSTHILTQYAELIRKSSEITSMGTSVRGSSPISGKFGNSQSLSINSSVSDTNVSEDSKFELNATTQTWTKESDGSIVFNTPNETGKKLDSCQGKVDGYHGTCGLVSCVNVLRLAGYPATESEVVGYASTTSAGFLSGKLCTTNSFPECNGGTTAKTRQQILQHFGIKNELKEASVKNIADAVSEGRGVIVSVYAGSLYGIWSNHRDLHAITVTSVKKDQNGNILGFYICDSGTGGMDNSKFYTASRIENALSGRPMNVTSIIR